MQGIVNNTVSKSNKSQQWHENRSKVAHGHMCNVHI